MIMGCVYALKLNTFLLTQHTVLAFTDSKSKSNHRRCSLRKSFLRNFLKLQEKSSFRVSFLAKLKAEGCNK